MLTAINWVVGLSVVLAIVILTIDVGAVLLGWCRAARYRNRRGHQLGRWLRFHGHLQG